MGRALVYLFLILLCAKVCIEVAEADHAVVLPGLPTPAINEMKATRTIKYCLNNAAVNYPGFSAQADKVLTEYKKRIGVTFERVTWGPMSATGCQYQLNMQEFSCNGCAAHIFYTLWPVISEYKPSLGYTSWESAISHETGHLFGLHERYRDSGGTIQCGGPDNGKTTMDCGFPFVAVPLALDISRICTMTLVTSWCGAKPDPVYPIYDAARNCNFYGYWCYDFDDGIWYDPQNVSEWQDWVNGQKYNRRTGIFYWTLPVTYQHNGTTWECIDNCLN